MNINIMELVKTASYHKGVSDGITLAVEDIIKQAQEEPETDETTVQEL